MPDIVRLYLAHIAYQASKLASKAHTNWSFRTEAVTMHADDEHACKNHYTAIQDLGNTLRTLKFRD